MNTRTFDTILKAYEQFTNRGIPDDAAATLTLAAVLAAVNVPPEVETLTVAQAAEWMNCCEKTIYLLCSSGLLNHHRVGKGRGAIRITRDDLNLYRRSNQG